MEYSTMIYGAALLLIALFASPALDRFNFQPFGGWNPKRFSLWDLISSESGVTITYLSDFANVNTATAPTAAQASQLPLQVAQIFWADTDTEAIVVHNWGGKLGPSWATFAWPICVLDKILGTPIGGSFQTQFTFGLGNSNQVYITKPVGASGGTHLLYMFLPHSLIARST